MSELRLHIVDIRTGWSEEVQLSDEEQELLSLQLERFCGVGTPARNSIGWMLTSMRSYSQTWSA